MGLVYNFIMPADLAARRRAKYCPIEARRSVSYKALGWRGVVESTGMRDPARLDLCVCVANASELARSAVQTTNARENTRIAYARVCTRVRARVRIRSKEIYTSAEVKAPL